MCGIAGIFTDGALKHAKAVDKMITTIYHRGPDDQGVWTSIDRKVGLAHSRLAIIDLSSAAHQPMSDESGSIWITYNGQIYNFKDLRDELISKGHIFKSHSDTEVIIHLYEEKGIDCLQSLRSMFAFAIWDTKKGALFIARDRLGIKPLYYYWDNSTFVFASEIKAIINSGLILKELDNEAIILYLKFGTIPSPKTIYKNIVSLEPAHYLILKNQHL